MKIVLLLVKILFLSILSGQSSAFSSEIIDLLNNAGVSEDEALRLMNNSGVSIDDLNKSIDNLKEYLP